MRTDGSFKNAKVKTLTGGNNIRKPKRSASELTHFQRWRTRQVTSGENAASELQNKGETSSPKMKPI